ncbi:hypothetical protein [Nocardia africana]
MRKNHLGQYFTEADKHGFPVDTNVSADIAVHGSFRVGYAANIDRVCVDVRPNESSAYAGMSMHLTLEQAAGLRDMLDAAMSDYLAAHVVSPLAIEAGGLG